MLSVAACGEGPVPRLLRAFPKQSASAVSRQSFLTSVSMAPMQSCLYGSFT
jgi:hypothetical protein